ncbi:hypothetical protein Dbac_0590 [Desulfomicrobium baculatum DSM 4028]|uniref:Uncharacterized protein n=1 Tax=Desulfomicrobium baculatum (strain DSM 4028 / VKM B-1378 / X) TaxID=525897 RepID=C7LX41_DESBD|nr:hypothetical protein Dbac_0590 [Desulfomicrobium baculatum DSM 4028]
MRVMGGMGRMVPIKNGHPQSMGLRSHIRLIEPMTPISSILPILFSPA